MTELNTTKRIAQNVLKLRRSKNISQRRLAQLMTEAGSKTVRQPQVSDIERAKSPQITVATLEKLARALDCKMDELISAGQECQAEEES